ncbi:MAG: LysE/ArgO family amino acid transporter [Pseudomonadota bacterium]
MPSTLSVSIAGFLLGASLIIAIGAQNAFILRLGLARQHVFVCCLICALSDALLIIAGVAGLGTLISGNSFFLSLAKWGGIAFLTAYALFAFHRATKPQTLDAEKSTPDVGTLRLAVGTCLALTFLNPHVYLDTVILLGSISTRYEPDVRPLFATGAVVASFVWFFSLGYGARLLQPLFAKPVSWRVLDVGIGCVMLAIAWSLLNTH